MLSREPYGRNFLRRPAWPNRVHTSKPRRELLRKINREIGETSRPKEAPLHEAHQILDRLQQERLANMMTEIVKAQLLSLHLGRLKDAGTFTPQQVSLAKRNNVNIATDIAREARRLLGANGILAEYASMRHMANLESVYTYEGTHDIHTLIIGQAITGLAAFE